MHYMFFYSQKIGCIFDHSSKVTGQYFTSAISVLIKIYSEFIMKSNLL